MFKPAAAGTAYAYQLAPNQVCCQHSCHVTGHTIACSKIPGWLLADAAAVIAFLNRKGRQDSSHYVGSQHAAKVVICQPMHGVAAGACIISCNISNSYGRWPRQCVFNAADDEPGPSAGWLTTFQADSQGVQQWCLQQPHTLTPRLSQLGHAACARL